MTNQGKNAIDIVLAESFKELATKKPIEKITIKEITDKAGVIRPTFYNHFQDKYELLEWVIRTETLDPIRPLIQNDLTNQAVLLIFTSMSNNREFFSRISRMDGPVTFDEVATKCLQKVLVEVFKEESGEKKNRFPWMSIEFLAEYYAKSMIFLVKIWIRQGMSVSPQEMANLYEYLMNHSMEDVMKTL